MDHAAEVNSLFLYSLDATDYISLASLKIEEDASGYDWGSCWVSIKNETFSGARRANFLIDDWSRFATVLRECERTRRGEAQLKTISPADFSLRIWNTRSKGDFALEYSLSTRSVSLQGGFEIDPSLLPQLVREVEDFWIEEK